MRKRNYQAKLQKLDEILGRALKKKHVPFRPEDRRLIEIWEKAVGPQIAAQSRPNRMRKEILLVNVSSSVWMQQLHFLKEEIIGKVNALTSSPPIKDIRFSIGQIPVPTVKGKEAAVGPYDLGNLKERDKHMMETCLASLKDEELKAILKKVMIKEITNRRDRERKAP